MTVPGIGPLIASAMVAAIANGAAFAKGRDFAAWLGLVPKQMSTGDRTILGHICGRRLVGRTSTASYAQTSARSPIHCKATSTRSYNTASGPTRSSKNMLLHSRQGSGEHRPVNINALVDESLNLAYHGARAKKQGFTITLERSFDPAAGEVDVFPQEITRALLNSISNGFYAATKRKAEANGGDYEPTLSCCDQEPRRQGRNPDTRQRHRYSRRR